MRFLGTNVTSLGQGVITRNVKHRDIIAKGFNILEEIWGQIFSKKKVSNWLMVKMVVPHVYHLVVELSIWRRRGVLA